MRTPIRFVLDRSGRTPASAKLLTGTGPPTRVIRDLAELNDLAGRHVLIEPGPTLAAALYTVADRIWVIRSPTFVREGLKAARIDLAALAHVSDITLGGDVLSEYLNPNSGAFFFPSPSADVVLERDASAGGL